jgi:hypothetical protein
MAVQQGIFSFSLYTPSPPILIGVAPPSSLAREVVAAVVVAVAVLREAGLMGGGGCRRILCSGDRGMRLMAEGIKMGGGI